VGLSQRVKVTLLSAGHAQVVPSVALLVGTMYASS